MFKYNEVYGMDLDKFSSEKIAKETNIINLSNEELLFGLTEIMGNMALGARLEAGKGWRQAAHEGSILAYEAYKRFYKEKQPEVFSKIAISIKQTPDKIKFWGNNCSISTLFEMLVEDGYYEPIREAADAGTA